MFKKFLMDQAHRDHIKNLYRWWNGEVFSFEISGMKGKEDNGQDSGMDEAVAALNSDEELSGGGFANQIEDWYASEGSDPPAQLQNSRSADDNISADFMQLTISDDRVATQAVASSHHYTVTTRVHEPNVTLSQSAGAHFDNSRMRHSHNKTCSR
jgi:hypothetical protein